MRYYKDEYSNRSTIYAKRVSKVCFSNRQKKKRYHFLSTRLDKFNRGGGSSTHTHTQTYTHTYTHTHSLSLSLSLSLPIMINLPASLHYYIDRFIEEESRTNWNWITVLREGGFMILNGSQNWMAREGGMHGDTHWYYTVPKRKWYIYVLRTHIRILWHEMTSMLASRKYKCYTIYRMSLKILYMTKKYTLIFNLIKW